MLAFLFVLVWILKVRSLLINLIKDTFHMQLLERLCQFLMYFCCVFSNLCCILKQNFVYFFCNNNMYSIRNMMYRYNFSLQLYQFQQKCFLIKFGCFSSIHSIMYYWLIDSINFYLKTILLWKVVGHIEIKVMLSQLLHIWYDRYTVNVVYEFFFVYCTYPAM